MTIALHHPPAIPTFRDRKIMDCSTEFHAARVRHLTASPMAELRTLARLDDDWDGEDARAIDRDAIRATETLIYNFYDGALRANLPTPEAVLSPLPDGGVRMDWRTLDRALGVVISGGSDDNVKIVWREPDQKLGHLLSLSVSTATENIAEFWKFLTQLPGV
jgi:hypothetical protein